MMDADALNRRIEGSFAAFVGVHFTRAEQGATESRLAIRPELLAANGYLHAASVIALADTSCGLGCMNSLPGGATGFTTIELKSNFLGTARDGSISCRASLSHGGRTTQVWDAVVTNDSDGKTIALFRCTQMILSPR